MLNPKKMTMLAVLGLLLANTSHAATLVTPALPKGTAASFQCGVVNVSSKEIGPVLLEIVGEAGAVLGENTVTIPPQATRSVASVASVGLNYCRVTGISKGKARVTLCTRDASFNCLQSVTIP
jgi:hypothetical protein